MASTPLRQLITSLSLEPSAVSDSALILIDCQQTYREGVMKLTGVEPALKEAAELLARFRSAGRPIFHIIHDSGPGSLYDTSAAIGSIADVVAPAEGEVIISKNYPSSFENTELKAELDKLGIKNLILTGFMTHCCVNSTARAGFNLGFANTVVASATATRPLAKPTGGEVAAQDLHDASLAALADIFAVVVPRGADVPD